MDTAGIHSEVRDCGWYSLNREGRIDEKGAKCEEKAYTHTHSCRTHPRPFLIYLFVSFHLEPAGQKQTQKEEQG